MNVKELEKWLSDNGLGEEVRGHGHATSLEIAEKLLEAFTIIPHTTDGQPRGWGFGNEDVELH